MPTSVSTSDVPAHPLLVVPENRIGLKNGHMPLSECRERGHGKRSTSGTKPWRENFFRGHYRLRAS
jgi:hypothetical protein